MVCAACELRVVTVAALEAALEERFAEAERRARIEGALPYMADMLCLIARSRIPGLNMPLYSQMIDPQGAPAKDERTALEIIDDVIAAL